MSKRIPGHKLLLEGAAHDSNGYRIHRGTGGIGYAQCECGAKSPVLESGNQRQSWHRAHKEETQPTNE